MVWLLAIAVVLFFVCWAIGFVSILRFWKHFAKWLRPRYGRRPRPLYWDLFPLTFGDYRGLFSTAPDAKAHEREAARTHLIRTLAAVASGLLLGSIVLVLHAVA